MRTIILSEEARIQVASAAKSLTLYKELYNLSNKDADIAEYSKLIKTRLGDAQLSRDIVIAKYVQPELSDTDLTWKLDYDSGELIIND